MDYPVSKVCVIGNLTCMGCCGHSFKGKKAMERDIEKNTILFNEIKDKKEFKEQPGSEYLRDSGICKMLIFKDKAKKQVMCSIHPALNSNDEKRDLREGYCDMQYMCKTAYAYNKWGTKKQKAFIKFILSKNLDWYNFSIGMDSDLFLNEFEANYEVN